MATTQRPNFLVRAARRLKGAFSDTRRDPATGAKQVKLGARGGWVSIAPDSRPHPKPPGKATNYLAAPQRPAVARKASAPIGMGRIGMGEGIGTTRGTASASWKGGRPAVGESGITGFSRIGVGGTPRGSAAGAAMASSSGS